MIQKKNGQRRYKYTDLGRDKSYSVRKRKKQSDSIKEFSETDIIKMLEFVIDNIFVMLLGGRIFQQTVGIHMGPNCTPLLTYLFRYTYEALSMSLQ